MIDLQQISMALNLATNRSLLIIDEFGSWSLFQEMLRTLAAIGAKHGVPCPTIARLVALIHEVEGGRPQSDALLLELLP